MRALLVDSRNCRSDGTTNLREDDEPAFTTVGSDYRRVSGGPRAFLVDGDNASKNGSIIHDQDGPSPTVGRARTYGWLVGGANTSAAQAAPGVGVSEAEEPTRVVAANSDRWKAPPAAGRVVRMTPRALARFQSVPDSFVLPEKGPLACRVIGNGVPCILARRVMESLS